MGEAVGLAFRGASTEGCLSHHASLDPRAPPASSQRSRQGSPNPPEGNVRQTKPVNLALPVILSGMDSAGNDFQESTRTTVASKLGAKITTTRDLALGAVVAIANRNRARAANVNRLSPGKESFCELSCGVASTRRMRQGRGVQNLSQDMQISAILLPRLARIFCNRLKPNAIRHANLET